MIITGAPVEKMKFEEVDYWPELCDIFEWAKTNVFSTLYLCWGAQAGIYYHYGVEKHMLPEKNDRRIRTPYPKAQLPFGERF